jgi:two-component system OmpR family sensor kinase
MEEVERLTTLVEDLLALARLDARQERGATENVLLHFVVRDAIERVQQSARERQIDIELSGAVDVSARVPRAAAGLVLVNLLDNAVKFSPPGARISIGLASEGADAVVRVSDTGPGIAPEELPHLFERFYRGSGPRAAHAPGFGLGLALSQAIVDAHGGRLDAANRPEGGAVFTLRLPCAA